MVWVRVISLKVLQHFVPFNVSIYLKSTVIWVMMVFYVF